MNQEQNNLNPNNFNTQGNNGIPNNQPLNNQSFNQGMGVNQQPINPQPQPTPSFQQPINQMNIEQPTPQPMNTFESGNTNNQNFNSKPPKKMNLGLIIGIVAAVAVIIVVGIILMNKPTSNDNFNNSENSENNIVDENTSTKNEFLYTLIINNVEYKFPLNYDEMINRGWVSYCSTIGVETTEDFSNSLIAAGSYGSPFYGGCGGMSIEGISNVKVIFDNTYGTEDKKVKDCDVIGITFGKDETKIPKGAVSIKGPKGTITVGESTTDDVINFFDGNYNYIEDDGTIIITYDDQNIMSWITFSLEP